MNKLPRVNREYAQKLLEQSGDGAIKKKKLEAQNLLGDDRFSAMFESADFQVDTESEEYRLLNPLVSHIDKVRRYTALTEK